MAKTQPPKRDLLRDEFNKAVGNVARSGHVTDRDTFMVLAFAASRMGQQATELRELREVVDTFVAELQDMRGMMAAMAKHAPAMMPTKGGPQ